MMELNYRKTDEMKNSGVEWLEIIPKEWQIKKLKYLVNVNPLKSEIKNKKKMCSFVPMEKIKNGLIQLDEVKHVYEVYNQYTYFKEEDIIMAKVTPCYENGNIGIAKNLVNGIGFGTTEIVVFRATTINNIFLFYRMQESHFINYGKSHMTGVAGLKRVPNSYFDNFKIATPNIEEQDNIANFLDIKTAEFDSIITKKEQLIEKLEEAKKSLISEVVTGKVKIVNGEMVKRQPEELKDSGVEWLGMVPRSWVFITFRRISTLKQGLQIDKAKRHIEKTENRFVYITIKYLHSDKQEDEIEFIQNPDKGVLCVKDDILLARTGATGLVVTDVEGVYHNNFFKVIYNKMLIEKYFMVYYLKEPRLIETLQLKAGTTTIPDLNHSEFLDTEFLLPCLQEQTHIINFLDKKISRIDQLITKLNTQIELITSAKQSLISEAVTGKIDLRDWKIMEGEVLP